MRDKLADGRSFRILTVVDQFTRECVGLTADRSMTGMKAAQTLDAAQQERGRLPDSITVDNGSEFSGIFQGMRGLYRPMDSNKKAARAFLTPLPSAR